MTLEQTVYEEIKQAFDADTGAGGLQEAGGAAFVNGGMNLASEAPQKRNVPRIEVEVRVTYHLEAGEPSGERGATGLVLMHLFADRRKSFGTGDTPEAAGRLSVIADRMESTYDQWKPTLTGWSSGRWVMMPPRVGPETPEVAHRILPFSFGATKT